MRRISLGAVLLAAGSLVWGQQINLNLLNLDSAQASLAGPDSIYITSIQYAGQTYSALLKYDGGTTATVEQIFGADGKLFPDTVDLRRTELALERPNVLDISNVVVGGLGYSGQLRYTGGNKLEVADVRRISLPPPPEAQLAALQSEVTSAKAAATRVQNQLVDAQAAATRAEAEANRAKADLTQANAQLAQAKADADQAKRQVDQLKTAVTATQGPGLMVSASQLDTSLLSLESASVSVAGPDTVYISPILYAGKEYSARLRYDGGNTASVEAVFDTNSKLIPDSVDLANTKLAFVAPNMLDISNVVVQGLGYSGTLEFTGGDRFQVSKLQRVPVPEGLQQRVSELQSSNRQLSQQISSLQAEVSSTKSDLRRAQEAAQAAAAMPVSTAPAPPSRTVASGFGRGRALSGTWTTGASSVSQTNGSARFAKFAVPVSQSGAATLFGVRARASGSGWLGYGLHFFASGNRLANGWGFGRSYLVWLTRDERFYRTNTTYLQLYESSDDSTMVQLASIGIPESLSSSLTLEALYDRDSRTIQLSVNGTPRLTFPVSAPITAGDSVALRALGAPVEFSDLYVRTR